MLAKDASFSSTNNLTGNATMKPVTTDVDNTPKVKAEPQIPVSSPKQVDFELADFDDVLADYEDALNTNELDHTSVYDGSTVIGDDISSISISSTTFKRVQWMNFIVSYKFVIIVYVSVLIIQASLWLIFSGIDEGLRTTGSVRLLAVEVGVFDFTRGCIISSNATFVLGAQVACYILVELILFVMCIFADRDTWFLKGETFLVLALQIGLGIIYLSCASLQPVKYMTDYFFSYAYIPVVSTLVETFISVTLPPIYAIISDYNRHKGIDTKGNETSIVERFLKNKKTFSILLDYGKFTSSVITKPLSTKKLLYGKHLVFQGYPKV